MASELDLDAIEQRANAATKPPWTVVGRWHSGKNIARIRSWYVPVAVECGVDGYWVDGEDVRTPDNQACDNAGFIAHAREDIPALIARVRELEAADTEVSRASVALAERVRELEAIIDATARENECVSINADIWVQTNDDATGKPWLVMRNNEIIGDADTFWDAIEKGLADAK